MIAVDCVLPRISISQIVTNKISKSITAISELSIRATVFDNADDEEIYILNEDGQIIQNEDGQRIKNF